MLRTSISLIVALATMISNAQWTTLMSGTLEEFDAVLVDDENTYWVGGTNGMLMHTTDGGATWSTEMLAGAGDLEKIVRLDATTLLIAADDGVIARSVDNGATWTMIDTQAPNVLYDLTYVGDHVWASGRDGGMAYSADKGATWTLQNSGTTERLHGIFALDASNLISVGREGVLLNTNNGGNTWSSTVIAGGEDLRGVIFLNDVQRTGLIAGPEGEILRSTDQGNSWSSINIPTALEAQAFASEDAAVVYAVGDNALILKSEDQGQTWVEMTSNAFSELSGVDVKNGVAIAVGANGTILKLDPNSTQGIRDKVLHGDLNVYPNPSKGPVNIELSGLEIADDGFTLEICIADGRLVDRTNWPKGERRAMVQELAPGSYIIRLIAASGESLQRQLIVTAP